jgi:hypothetical protein
MNWFWNLWSRAPKQSPVVDEEDNRWKPCAQARVLARGRLCTRRGRGWQSEYLYDVFCNGNLQEVRIVLPEEFVAAWEKSLGRRMTEPMRSELANQTLTAAASMKPLPRRKVIEKSAVLALPPRDLA